MKHIIIAICVSMVSLSAYAAKGGQGHGKLVSAAAKDPARVKGKGGVSAIAKDKSGMLKNQAPAPAPAPAP